MNSGDNYVHGDSDTDVKSWNMSGELLQMVNTNQVAKFHCVWLTNVIIDDTAEEVSYYPFTRACGTVM